MADDGLEDLSRRRATPQHGLDPTRARPQPWFVGGGRAITALVVAAVAILLVLRGVSTVWLVEEAWTWWTHRPVAPAAAPRPPPIAAVEPPRPAPAPLVLPPGARAAKGADEASWITADDYPAESVRRAEQGATRIRWRIERDGRVRECGTVTSSGAPRLDAAGCRAILRSARYAPARDASGRAIPATRERTIRWVLPEI